MKETVSAEIASQAFTLDRDAYEMLDRYLNDIRSRIGRDDSETMTDIESRIAEILRERLPSPIMVVTAAHVRNVMVQIGSPEVFGSDSNSGNSDGPEAERTDRRQAGGDRQRSEYRPAAFRRSEKNRLLAGICGGAAEYFDCDVSLLRLLTAMMVLFGGLSVWVYIILWIVIPKDE